MNPEQFFSASRLVIVAGKGGVGKTVVAASLARAASKTGRQALLVEVQGRSGIGRLLGGEELTYEDQVLLTDPSGGAVRGRTIRPDDALIDWLNEHGMKRIAKRLVQTGVLEIIATATPGLRDLLVLGKVKHLEREGDADLIVVDAPAAGHAITFLRAARTLYDTARAGPIHNQAKEVLDMLADPARTQVLLVALAEETPINEMIETAYHLEDHVGVKLGPAIVNGCYPLLEGLDGKPPRAPKAMVADLERAAELRRNRVELQEAQLARLADELPVEQIRLPYRFDGDMDADAITILADHVLAGIGDLSLSAGGQDAT